MNISNTTVLITGGGSGIGLELAKVLLKENARVIICGRNQQKLDNAQLQVPELNLIQCDVAYETQVDNMIETVHSKFQGIDILINNAGIFQDYDVQKQNLPFKKYNKNWLSIWRRLSCSLQNFYLSCSKNQKLRL